jgi:hypothetical protein
MELHRLTATHARRQCTVGVAFDADAGTTYFYKNGCHSGTAAFTGLTADLTFPVSCFIWASTACYQLRPTPVGYAAPAGFKALCTTNLPEPTIADGSTVMDVKLYTGNGSTQTISGLNFSPDFVWIKQRSTSRDHCLCDVVRGTSKRLRSNTTDAETTESVV